jgi:hypothetical protein
MNRKRHAVYRMNGMRPNVGTKHIGNFFEGIEFLPKALGYLIELKEFRHD